MFGIPFLPDETSILEICAGLLAIIGGLYSLWSIFRPACVRMSVGDTVDLVVGADGPVKDFHLACTFENRGSRIGVVQLVKAVVQDPSGKSNEFKWQFFIEHEPGTLRRRPLGSRHAIAVRPGETEFVWIQFEGLDWADEADVWWKPGLYDFEISVWVNAENQESLPHTTARFRASVPEEFQKRVDEYRNQTEPVYWALGVVSWSPLEKCLPQMLKRARLKQ